MNEDELVETDVQAGATFFDNLRKIPLLVNQEDVSDIIGDQEATIDRLVCTNKSLQNCSVMAQNKLAATSRLYKRTAKQIAESKKDLDVIYKKILEMKTRIKTGRPDLILCQNTNCDQDEQTGSRDTEQDDKS